MNLLRAYDVTSNSFNLNQASLILERLPTSGEPAGWADRSAVWAGDRDAAGLERERAAAAGVAQSLPGVWELSGAGGVRAASWILASLRARSATRATTPRTRLRTRGRTSFNYLPFYHMGLRANYNVTPKVNVAYWLVNGANDTEDLNGYKSQAFLFTLKPASSVTWNVNYYFGEEARDVLPTVGTHGGDDGNAAGAADDEHFARAERA